MLGHAIKVVLTYKFHVLSVLEDNKIGKMFATKLQTVASAGQI